MMLVVAGAQDTEPAMIDYQATAVMDHSAQP